MQTTTRTLKKSNQSFSCGFVTYGMYLIAGKNSIQISIPEMC